MDVQAGGNAPPTKWGWRYLAWAGVPLLAGVLLARYAGPAAPEAVARAAAAAEGSWVQHLASPLVLFLLQLLVLLLVAKGAGALLKRLGQPAVIGEMALTLARAPGAAAGSDGLTLFYLETRDEGGQWNGIRIDRLKDKLGTRELPTAEIHLDGTLALPVNGLEHGVRMSQLIDELAPDDDHDADE